MDSRGQAAMVGTAVTLIISLVIGIIVVHNLFISGAGPTTEQFIYTDYALTNTSFTSNVSGWDNYIENGAVNAWNSGGYVTVTTTENDAKTDNGIWYQGVTISSFDTVDSATTTFKCRVIDNAGRSSIVVKALLGRPSDNVTLYNVTLTENSASWTTVENNVKSYITAAGTYRLYLRAELLGTGVGVNLQVGFDDANLSIRPGTDNPSYDAAALAAFNNVKTLSWAGIGLMALAIIVLAAVTILGIVRGGLSGGGKI